MDSIRKQKIFEASVFGFSFPTMCVIVEARDLSADFAALARVEAALLPHLNNRGRAALEKAKSSAPNLLASHVNGILTALENDGSMPMLGRAIIQRAVAEDSGILTSELLFVETIDPYYTRDCLALIMRLDKEPVDRIPDLLKQQFERAPAFARKRTNNKYLLPALGRAAIPSAIIPGGIILCGWGKNSRLLNSSGTEHTAALSAEVVRDKLAAQVMMMRFGLPIAEAHLVNDSEKAKAAASAIGFPVVVKPRAEDGGEGVTRAVNDDAALLEAFTRASSSKSGVLVQRHIEGREYRMTVVNGTIICAYERLPAMVEGDGKLTVEQLVMRENARREALSYEAIRNFPILLGEDADRNLAHQQLSRASVPPEGMLVRLSTVPRVKEGGTVSLIDVADLDPSVASSIIDAARIFRLDVAGVDYIATDCTLPVEHANGIITEVNAFPQIIQFDELDTHRAFIETALPGVGKVPSVLIVDDGYHAEADAINLVTAAAESGLRPGLIVDSTETAERLTAQGLHCVTFKNKLGVLADLDVDCVIVLQGLRSIQEHGAFLPSFDAVVLSSRKTSETIAALTSQIMIACIKGPLLVPDQDIPASLQELAEILVYSEISDRNTAILGVLRG